MVGLLRTFSHGPRFLRYVTCWMNAKENPNERQLLGQFFDRHVPFLLDAFKTKLKATIPVPDISIIQTLCCLLDAILPADSQGEVNKDAYETWFHFACIWAFGGPLLQDQVKNCFKMQIYSRVYSRKLFSLCALY